MEEQGKAETAHGQAPAIGGPLTFPPGAYDEYGVDLTLIRWMLALTPLERLQQCQRAAQSLQELLEHTRANRLPPGL